VSDLTYLKALLLGIVQGLTEFLPVSSSGHLALLQDRLHLDPDSPALLLFDVLAHVGTVIAVLIVFAGPLGRYVARLRREASPMFRRRRYALRIALLGVVASVPTAGIGLAFKDTFEAAFARPRWVAGGLLLTGLLLLLTLWVPRGRRGWGRFGGGRALLVGVAQGLAILPGLSRSGATICTALYGGLRRRWAGEFSFFIAVPAILGATVLKLRDTWRLAPEVRAALPWGPLLLGAVVSLIVGVVALKWLLHTVRRGQLHWFALYVWMIGVLVLVAAPKELTN